MAEIPTRRLEDRIRKLCTSIIAESDLEYSEVLAELQTAVNEIVRRLDNKQIASVLSCGEQPLDRRARAEK